MATVPDAMEPVQLGTIPMSLLTVGEDEMLDVARTGFVGDFPGEPCLPFADWLEIQGQVIRLKGSPTACWLGAKIDELADWARRLKASTPADFDARFELEQDAMIARVRAQGFDEAVERQLCLDWEVPTF